MDINRDCRLLSLRGKSGGLTRFGGTAAASLRGAS
jgi:hypothetical protein